MFVTCKFSGVTFQVGHFSDKMRIEGIHPIFFASQDRLLQRAGQWAAGKLSEEENKLLFLALLNSMKRLGEETGLVEFRATARIHISTVQQNMENLLKFIAWYSDVRTPNLKLPRFAVTNDTATLKNVKHWLEIWQEHREAWEDNYKTRSFLEMKGKKEAALDRFVNSTRDTETYAKQLADWAMVSAEVPEALREYWTELFSLKGMAVYSARSVDLEELREHMEVHLEAGTTYAYKVLQHVRKLETMNKTGLQFMLGMELEEISKIDLLAAVDTPFRVVPEGPEIVEDSIETQNKEAAAVRAPVKEPKPEDYPTRAGYVLAKAAWNLAEAQRKKVEAVAYKQAEVLKKVAIDSLNLEEYQETQRRKDVEQLFNEMGVAASANKIAE